MGGHCRPEGQVRRPEEEGHGGGEGCSHRGAVRCVFGCPGARRREEAAGQHQVQQASEVTKDANAVKYAEREHAKQVAQYNEVKAELAEANKDLGHATKAHADQLAEEKRENAKAAA